MAGRTTFQRVKPVLVTLSAVLRLLPGGLRGWLWTLSDGLPGTLGAGCRYALARASGASLGDNVYFGRGVTVKNWRNLRLGRNVSIHEHCFLDALGGITVGDDVSIAHGASLVAFDHGVEAGLPLKYGPLLPGPIVVSSDVWISAGVRVLRDTTIGTRTILAANAVARGDLAGGAIYGGVPARRLKTLEAADPPAGA